MPNGSELCVLMDEHSRMPLVAEVRTTAAEFVLPVLDDWLSTIGIPKEIKSDNGPPFNGHQFEQFASYMGFKHRKITPEWAQANGQVENFMKNLGKVVRSSIVEDSNWRQDMNKFLRSYRSTPHATTGVSPSKLLFGRDSTSRLPSLACDSTIPATTAEALQRDESSKFKSSEL
jgi:transposase InsO family protein